MSWFRVLQQFWRVEDFGLEKNKLYIYYIYTHTHTPKNNLNVCLWSVVGVLTYYQPSVRHEVPHTHQQVESINAALLQPQRNVYCSIDCNCARRRVRWGRLKIDNTARFFLFLFRVSAQARVATCRASLKTPRTCPTGWVGLKRGRCRGHRCALVCYCLLSQVLVWRSLEHIYIITCGSVRQIVSCLFFFEAQKQEALFIFGISTIYINLDRKNVCLFSSKQLNANNPQDF